MIVEVDCPLCQRRMTVLWTTEWTDGKQRTVDVLCPNCAHRETIYLSIERKSRREK